MSRLPSLSDLQLLSSLVQDKSITRAARKVGMTQSAASRRLAVLEEELGVPLFERHRRGVEPTLRASQYVAEILPALDRIVVATDAIRAFVGTEPLRLRVYPTFAAKWLLQRLPQFQEAYPNVEVKLDTVVAPIDFQRDQVDLAIQFGDSHWPGVISQPLFRDKIEPVCRPDFAIAHGIDEATAGLKAIRLLGTNYRRTDWADWASYAGISLSGATWMELPNSLLAYHAAAEGIGMAMGQTRLLGPELAKGTLITPFNRPLAREAGYYLLMPRRAEPRRSRLFRQWVSRLVQWEEPAKGRL